METAEEMASAESKEATTTLFEPLDTVSEKAENLATDLNSTSAKTESGTAESMENNENSPAAKIEEDLKENGDVKLNGILAEEKGETTGEEAKPVDSAGSECPNNEEIIPLVSLDKKEIELSVEEMSPLVIPIDSDDDEVEANKDETPAVADKTHEATSVADDQPVSDEKPAESKEVQPESLEIESEPKDSQAEAQDSPDDLDLTEVAMEVEPPIASSTEEPVLPEVSNKLVCEESIEAASTMPEASQSDDASDEIKNDEADKVEDVSLNEPEETSGPRSPNIIELSDDSDDEMGPPEPKRPSIESKSEKIVAVPSSGDVEPVEQSSENCQLPEETASTHESSPAEKKPPTDEDVDMKSLTDSDPKSPKDDPVEELKSQETSDIVEATNLLTEEPKSLTEDSIPPKEEDSSVSTHEDKPHPIEDVVMEDTKPVSMEIDLLDVKDESDHTPSDTEDRKDFYRDKECVNYECQRKWKRYVKAPIFVLNFYKISRKSNKVQFVCEKCFDQAVDRYADLAASLEAHEPLLKQNIPKRQEFVEILDSSDEEDGKEAIKPKLDLDEPVLEEETIEMLQKELDNTICEILGRVEIKKQIDWSKTILKDKLNKMEVECQEITDSLKKLQKDADRMHTSLYQCPKIKIKELQSLDLNTGRPFTSDTEYSLPPLGELKYPAIEMNGNYFAVRNKVIASWLPCRVVEFVDLVLDNRTPVKYYKVKYLKLKIPTVKCISAKHMAYGEPPNVRLSIGTRVIALFDASTLSRNNKEIIAPSAFYPGIIAEQLQAYNKYRYLIFFDDGYAQYVHHKDVHIVCQAAENVWEDVHPGSREFIRNYLSQYQKHRPMVQVKKGQSMITESNGKWLYAKVVDVDGSLVQMQFDGQNRYEWIYRGSTRLGPLFKEKQANGNVPTQSTLGRRSEPYVRYDEDASRNDAAQPTAAARAVAKKSTATAAAAATTRQESQPANAPVNLNNSTIFLEDDNRPKGKVVYYTAKKNLPPKTFVPHQCYPACLFTVTHNLQSYSPLAKPLLSGWERQIFKSKLKKSVVYRAPCGRRIRNMEELHKYLRLTKNILNVDNFDFDCAIHCLAEYVIESSIVAKPDISMGIENMVIPCVNYYDNTMPPSCEYSVERVPTEGVKINLDPAFLGGCDCEDDCSDKSKCSCWQLTLEGTRFGNQNVPAENVGYTYKRLLDPVQTGIYECNVNCKCSDSCLNRVVQQSLNMKLQLFKTSNRGWGLRCLNDVPKGSFICIYAGHLLTEQKANEGGVNASDEYFAELDYIEVVERIKEGYESDVQEDNDSEDEDIEEPNPDADSDEDFRTSAAVNKDASINTRLRARRSTTDGEKSSKNSEKSNKNGDCEVDSQERRVINYEPTTSLGTEEPKRKFKSVRKLFGKNEFVYVMDAKTMGNIGRYFNHSCSPNLFVQNVFVDTQDPRFPWVAFFALNHIRAGTELTWNYNYEVGIVPGKVLYCECGAPNCRGRLL